MVEKLKQRKIKLVVCLIFMLVFGAVYFIMGAVVRDQKKFLKNALPIEAEITSIEKEVKKDGGERKISHSTYVTYIVDGKVYSNVPLGYYNSNMYEGKRITVYYDPQNPGRIESREGHKILNVIYRIGQIVLGAVTVIMLLLLFLPEKRSRLMKIGTRYDAEVVSVFENRSIRVNGRHPYQVDCRVHDPYSGEVMLFRSHNVYQDLYQYNLKVVPVYVNPKKKKSYYVDVQAAIAQQIGNTDAENVQDYR